MELADLARWTPIRFDFSGPVPLVDWADLTAERFVDPFFDETVASLFAEPPGWLGLQGRPHQAARLFGLDPAAVPAMSRGEFAGRVLGAMWTLRRPIRVGAS
jgi:hypothetical protein